MESTADSQTKTIGQALKDSLPPEARIGDIHPVELDCPTHGRQQANVVCLSTGWSVPTCKACLQERQETEDREDTKRREREERERRAATIRDHLSRAAIPSRFVGKTFETYQPNCPASQKALKVCRTYAHAFPENMRTGTSAILCGNAGAGKTHLACAVAQHVIREHGRTAVYMTVGRAFRMVKDTYRRDAGRSEEEVLAFFAMPDLLILDEIGVQYGSDAEKNILFEIVNERYEALKPTILISNLAMPALTEYAGERVIDRMKENGGMLVVFGWKSHRGAA